MSLSQKFTDIANAIRAKTGKTASMTPAEMPNEIASIVKAVLQTKTVSPSTSSQTVNPDVDYNGMSSVTVNAIPNQKSAATYNTSSSDQTINANQWLLGVQTIKAVTTSNISATNIKAGVNVKVGDSDNSGRISDVTGTFTSDADAVAANILSGKTAYVNGNKITGTLATYDGTVE